jgi:hypothetical protein
VRDPPRAQRAPVAPKVPGGRVLPAGPTPCST